MWAAWLLAVGRTSCAAAGGAGRAGTIRREFEVGAGGQALLATAPHAIASLAEPARGAAAARAAAAEVSVAREPHAHGAGHVVHDETVPEPAPAATTETVASYVQHQSSMVVDATTSMLVLVPPVLGLCWCAYEVVSLRRIQPLSGDDNTEQKVLQLSGFIADGSQEFLKREYTYLSVFILLGLICIGGEISVGSMAAFLAGALTSCLCGFIGMQVAVFCNWRTTLMAWREGLAPSFNVAVRGGSIMGICLVSLGVITLYCMMLIYYWVYGDSQLLWQSLAGYGLGGSSVALFARVGGGIYTKAADVGADLSGKNEYGMDEDDPRNPAVIADNVGDNVGDIAGMGADLFGSFAESTCAALVISGTSHQVAAGLTGDWGAMCFPLVISSSGILTGWLSLGIVRLVMPITEACHVERALKAILLVAAILETPMILGFAKLLLPPTFALSADLQDVKWWTATLPVLIGLWGGLVIGVVTEYFTSHSYAPVREIAESQKTSAATGIIFGLALGYMSCVIPTLALAGTIVASYIMCGMYGVALAALGMLSTLTMGLTIDGFGPICDNAGGLAEMANLPAEVRERTDALDAAGNTTAAVGKGFAIGSAALVSLALFGAYCEQVNVKHLDLMDAWCIMGLLVGAMLPFAFSALTMRSVAKAANAMVQECFEQFPKILNEGKEPDYQRCIRISTDASLKEMIAPGCLVVMSPITAGCLFGRNCAAGLLVGALTSGVMCATSMSNSGGAWDNSKKYIKAGGLGEEHKKNDTHKNSVTGDTVGDPMKDTSGPSLNILIKLGAITALIFAPVISRCSNESGGPFWLPATAAVQNAF